MRTIADEILERVYQGWSIRTDETGAVRMPYHAVAVGAETFNDLRKHLLSMDHRGYSDFQNGGTLKILGIPVLVDQDMPHGAVRFLFDPEKGRK